MRSLHMLMAAVLVIALGCCSFSMAAEFSLETIGSKCVSLRNAHYDEYMYSPYFGHYAVDSNSNRVFTWKDKINVGKWESTYQKVWIFQKDTACPSCYTIKTEYSEHRGEPLYSVSSTDPTFKDSSRRPVYTYRNKSSLPGSGSEHIWQMETVAGYSDRFRIKNKSTGEYLYAADEAYQYDKDRRYVFTWSSKDEADVDTWVAKKGDWIVEKANCP